MSPIDIINTASQLQGNLWLIALLIIPTLLWLWSVVHIAKRKTEDPYDRIVWLLIVLLLSFVGTVLYYFFGPHVRPEGGGSRKIGWEEEIKRRANEGTL